jgi:hypothetical protein
MTEKPLLCYTKKASWKLRTDACGRILFTIPQMKKERKKTNTHNKTEARKLRNKNKVESSPRPSSNPPH